MSPWLAYVLAVLIVVSGSALIRIVFIEPTRLVGALAGDVACKLAKVLG